MTTQARIATDEEMCAKCGAVMDVGASVLDVDTTDDLPHAVADWATIHAACVAKPECRLVGTDGNVFAIIGKVARVLRGAGQRDAAAEFTSRAMSAESYDAVLRLCFEYVDVA